MKSWKTWWMKLDQKIGRKLQGSFLIALMCNVCRDGRRFSIQSWWKDPGQKRSEKLHWLFCHTTQQDVLANHNHNYYCLLYCRLYCLCLKFTSSMWVGLVGSSLQISAGHRTFVWQIWGFWLANSESDRTCWLGSSVMTRNKKYIFS